MKMSRFYRLNFSMTIVFAVLLACEGPQNEKEGAKKDPDPSTEEVFPEVVEGKVEPSGEDDLVLVPDSVKDKEKVSEEMVPELREEVVDEEIEFVAETFNKFLVVNSMSENFSYVSLEGDGLEVTQNLAMSDADANIDCMSPNVMKEFEGHLYLVCSLSHQIHIFEKQSLKLARIIQLPQGSNPWDIVFYNSQRAFVSTFNHDSVLVINPTVDALDVSDRIVKEIGLRDLDYKRDEGQETQPKPEGLTIINNTLYVAITNMNAFWSAGGPGYVVAIDPDSLEISELIQTSGRNTVALAPGVREVDKDLLYIVNAGSRSMESGFTGDGSVDVYDTVAGEFVDSFNVGAAPFEIVLSEDGKAYLTNGLEGIVKILNLEDGGSLTEIDVRRNICNGYQFEEGKDFSFVSAIEIDSAHIYITEFNSDCFMIIDRTSLEVVNSSPTGDGPDVLLPL